MPGDEIVVHETPELTEYVTTPTPTATTKLLLYELIILYIFAANIIGENCTELELKSFVLYLIPFPATKIVCPMPQIVVNCVTPGTMFLTFGL